MFGQNSFAALSSAVDQPVPSSSALQLSEEQGEEADIDWLSLKKPQHDVHVRVAEKMPALDSLPGESCLLAVSNIWGLAVVGGERELRIHRLNDISTALETGSRDLLPVAEPIRVLSLPARPLWVRLALGDLRLVVGLSDANGVAVWDLKRLVSGDKTDILHHFDSTPSPLLNLIPNPSIGGAMPNIVAAVSSSSIAILDVEAMSVVSTFPGSFTCACWSVKGKQLIAGTASGDLVQYTPSGDEKARIPPPPSLDPASNFFPSSVQWLENDVFLVTYSQGPEPDGEPVYSQEVFAIQRQPRVSPPHCVYTHFIDPLPPSGVYGRTGGYRHIVHLRNWGSLVRHLVVMSSPPSADIAVMGATSTDGGQTFAWRVLNLEETSRASIPAVPDTYEETSCLGVELDTRTKTPIKQPMEGGVEQPDLPPAPRVLAYTSEGILVAYDIVIPSAGPYGEMTNESDIATGNPAPAAQPSPSIAPSGTSPVKPVAFGASSTSSKPAFGNAAPAFGSSAFGKPAAASASPSFGSSAFGQPATPAASGFGSSSFGKPATPASSTPSGFGASSAAPAFGSPAFGKPATPAASTPSAFAQAPTTPAFGSSSFGKPTTPSSAFGSSAFGAAPASGGFAGFGKKDASPSAFGASPSGTGFVGFGNKATASPFGSASPSAGSGFGAFAKKDASPSAPPAAPSGSAFGASTPNPFGTSAFGKPSSSAANSNPFSTPSKSAFGSSAFGTSTPSTEPKPAVAPTFGAFGAKPVTETKQPTSGGFDPKPVVPEAPAEKARSASVQPQKSPERSAASLDSFGGFADTLTSTSKPAGLDNSPPQSPVLGAQRKVPGLDDDTPPASPQSRPATVSKQSSTPSSSFIRPAQAFGAGSGHGAFSSTPKPTPPAPTTPTSTPPPKKDDGSAPAFGKPSAFGQPAFGASSSPGGFGKPAAFGSSAFGASSLKPATPSSATGGFAGFAAAPKATGGFAGFGQKPASGFAGFTSQSSDAKSASFDALLGSDAGKDTKPVQARKSIFSGSAFAPATQTPEEDTTAPDDKSNETSKGVSETIINGKSAPEKLVETPTSPATSLATVSKPLDATPPTSTPPMPVPSPPSSYISKDVTKPVGEASKETGGYEEDEEDQEEEIPEDEAHEVYESDAEQNELDEPTVVEPDDVAEDGDEAQTVESVTGLSPNDEGSEGQDLEEEHSEDEQDVQVERDEEDENEEDEDDEEHEEDDEEGEEDDALEMSEEPLDAVAEEAEEESEEEEDTQVEAKGENSVPVSRTLSKSPPPFGFGKANRSTSAEERIPSVQPGETVTPVSTGSDFLSRLGPAPVSASTAKPEPPVAPTPLFGSKPMSLGKGFPSTAPNRSSPLASMPAWQAEESTTPPATPDKSVAKPAFGGFGAPPKDHAPKPAAPLFSFASKPTGLGLGRPSSAPPVAVTPSARPEMPSASSFGGFETAPANLTTSETSDLTPVFTGFGASASTNKPPNDTKLGFSGFGATPKGESERSLSGNGAPPSGGITPDSKPGFGGFGASPSMKAPDAAKPLFGGFGGASSNKVQPPAVPWSSAVSQEKAQEPAAQPFAGFGESGEALIREKAAVPAKSPSSIPPTIPGQSSPSATTAPPPGETEKQVVAPTRQAYETAFKPSKVDESSKGLAGAFLQAYQLMENDLASLSHTLKSRAAFHAAVYDSKAAKLSKDALLGAKFISFSNLDAAGDLLRDLTIDASRAAEKSDDPRNKMAEVQSLMFKTEAKASQASKLYKARTDPSYAKMMRVRQLGPEHAYNQLRLRKETAAVQARIKQLELQIAALARKAELHDNEHVPMKAPTLDTVNRAVRNIDTSLRQKQSEVDALANKIKHLTMSPSRASGNRSTPSSPAAKISTPLKDALRHSRMSSSSSKTLRTPANAEAALKSLSASIRSEKREALLTQVGTAPATFQPAFAAGAVPLGSARVTAAALATPIGKPDIAKASKPMFSPSPTASPSPSVATGTFAGITFAPMEPGSFHSSGRRGLKEHAPKQRSPAAHLSHPATSTTKPTTSFFFAPPAQ